MTTSNKRKAAAAGINSTDTPTTADKPTEGRGNNKRTKKADDTADKPNQGASRFQEKHPENHKRDIVKSAHLEKQPAQAPKQKAETPKTHVQSKSERSKKSQGKEPKRPNSTKGEIKPKPPKKYEKIITQPDVKYKASSSTAQTPIAVFGRLSEESKIVQPTQLPDHEKPKGLLDGLDIELPRTRRYGPYTGRTIPNALQRLRDKSKAPEKLRIRPSPELGDIKEPPKQEEQDEQQSESDLGTSDSEDSSSEEEDEEEEDEASDETDEEDKHPEDFQDMDRLDEDYVPEDIHEEDDMEEEQASDVEVSDASNADGTDESSKSDQSGESQHDVDTGTEELGTNHSDGNMELAAGHRDVGTNQHPTVLVESTEQSLPSDAAFTLEPVIPFVDTPCMFLDESHTGTCIVTCEYQPHSS